MFSLCTSITKKIRTNYAQFELILKKFQNPKLGRVFVNRKGFRQFFLFQNVETWLLS